MNSSFQMIALTHLSLNDKAFKFIEITVWLSYYLTILKGITHCGSIITWVLEENINYLKDNGLYNEIDTIEGANGPKIKINGKSYINLSSNNYLGLATNEDLKNAAKAAIDSHGVGLVLFVQSMAL